MSLALNNWAQEWMFEGSVFMPPPAEGNSGAYRVVMFRQYKHMSHTQSNKYLS